MENVVESLELSHVPRSRAVSVTPWGVVLTVDGCVCPTMFPDKEAALASSWQPKNE